MQQDFFQDIFFQEVLLIEQICLLVHKIHAVVIFRIEILVEHFRGLIFSLSQGQEHLAEDWELMSQFYLILQLEVVHN